MLLARGVFVLIATVFLTSIVNQYRSDAKVFTLCELATALYYDHEVPLDQLAMWLCIAYYESKYNTSAVGLHSEDFGILQISRLFWCDPRGIPSDFENVTNASFPVAPNVCNINCTSLLDDDITDDVICAKTIFNEHQGFEGDGYKAWAVYPTCQRQWPLVPEWCFPPGLVPLNLSSKAF